MDPKLAQTSAFDPSDTVFNILSFVQLIQKFRNSNLALNPEILDIYSEKERNFERKPSIWQTFIYSVRKYSENPFDLGKQIFEALFLVIFCKYLTPRIINSIEKNDTIKSVSYQRQYLIEDPEQRAVNYVRESNQKVFKVLLRQLFCKNIPSVKLWLRENISEVRASQTNPLEKQELEALIWEVKNTQSVMVLEYIINASWYLSIINEKNFQLQSIDMKFRIATLIKHSQFDPHELSADDYKIWLNLKRKNIVESGHYYKGLEKEQLVASPYMHQLHKVAEKNKNVCLGEMIKSKCFYCAAERYASSSVQKMGIYRCLSRKILNSLTVGEPF